MLKRFALFVLLLSSVAYAAEKVSITARTLKRIPSLNLVVATGNVKIEYGDVTLEADEVRLNTVTKDLVAQGHVVLWQRGGYLACERLEFNLETKEGIAYRAKGFLPPYYYFSGERIKKLSGGVYHIRDGMLTTCETDWRACAATPDWSFRGKRVLIKREGFARIYGLTGWVKKVPVLYSPFFMFPVSSKRKTGFLIPTFGWKGGNGLFLNIPFFWAISRDKDATFWFRPYTTGDYQVAAEYRQKFAKDEDLYLYGDYMERSGESKGDWWNLKGKAFKRLPWDFEFSGKLDMTSTTKYKKEYSGDFSSYVKRHNDSYGELVKRFDHMRLSLLTRFQDDVEDNFQQKVYKYPQLDWELYPVKLWSSPFYLEARAQYLKYRNKNDTAGFDFKVSRWDLYPKLSLPINPVPWFSITPKYGLRYTVWSKRLSRKGDEVDEPTSRVMYSFEVDSRGPLLYRDYAWGNTTVRNDIVPEVKYIYIPDETKAQRDIIRFDDADFMAPKNLVTYSLTSRFTKLDTGRELLKLKLEQSYDIYRDRHGLPYKFSDIMFEADASPNDDLNFRYRLYQSVYGFGVTKWSFSGRVQHRFRDFLPSLGITYYYEKFTGNRYMEYNPSLTYKRVKLSVYWKRDIYNSYWVERRWNLEVKGRCWSVVVGYRELDNRMSGKRNDRMITFFIVLRGLGHFGVGEV